MHLATRLLAIAALSLVFVSVRADTLIHLTSYPSVSVADSKSTVTISAEVRDQSGRLVADGTRVVLSSTLGRFRDDVVTTVGGIARGILVAGDIPGTATITATSLTAESTPATLEYEFVSDRSQLSTAKEYIEIVAPGYMQYTVDTQVVGAAAMTDAKKNKKQVAIRYRDISLTADDIQYTISTYELRARNASLKMGGIDKHFDELYLKLNARFGFGTTSFKVKEADAIVSQGRGIEFVRGQGDGSYAMPPEVDRYGLVEIHRSSFTPSQTQVSTMFDFQDISASPSTVSAKKAVIFPHRVIQFQKADIYVAASKVMSLPLYEVPLAGAHSPLVTDQILSVNNNQVGVNFPYYVALRPGVTEFFSFKTGEVAGRSDTTDHGAFLDYEFDWNKGDDMQGALQVEGIGRDDWSIGANQFLRLDDRSTAFAQVMTPTGRSFYGSGSVSRQFDGFSTSLTGSATRTLTGIQDTTQDYSVIIEKDPIKVGALPVRLTPGLTATMDSDTLDGQSQSGAGARVRAQSLPLKIDPNTSLTASFQTSYLKGANELPGLQYLGNVSISKRLNSATSLLFTYDYTRDGFNELVLGEHRVSLQGYYNKGRVNFSIFGARSLDLQRTSLFGDLSYRLSRLWRLTSSYTSDTYLNDTYLDYTFGFGYTLGWREVGLVWSAQTQRIGLQLLGTTLY